MQGSLGMPKLSGLYLVASAVLPMRSHKHHGHDHEHKDHQRRHSQDNNQKNHVQQ